MAVTVTVGCISLPERPVSEEPECAGNFFRVRNEVSTVQQENLIFQIAIWYFGVGFAVWLGPFPLIFPILGSPIGQYRNKMRADGIVEEWKVRNCGQIRKA